MVTTPRRFGRQPCQDSASRAGHPPRAAASVPRAKMGGACEGAGWLSRPSMGKPYPPKITGFAISWLLGAALWHQ
jgi:hypothetical protein